MLAIIVRNIPHPESKDTFNAPNNPIRPIIPIIEDTEKVEKSLFQYIQGQLSNYRAESIL